MSTPATNKLQSATSGRARCRSCGGAIVKGDVRFGEVVAAGYGEGDAGSTFWFHVRCAAARRPEKLAPLLLTEAGTALPDRDLLQATVDEGLAHPNLRRLAGAQRAASGRAKCRHCYELIAEGAWRILLSDFAESGFFDPLGFLHAWCAGDYFGTTAIRGRLQVAAPDLPDAALDEITAAARP